MGDRAYEPKVGNESLVIETFVPPRESVDEKGAITFDRKPGESFVVGDEDHPWPYATANTHEQAVLDGHPSVKRVAVAEAESFDPIMVERDDAEEAAAEDDEFEDLDPADEEKEGDA